MSLAELAGEFNAAAARQVGLKSAARMPGMVLLDAILLTIIALVTLAELGSCLLRGTVRRTRRQHRPRTRVFAR